MRLGEIPSPETSRLHLANSGKMAIFPAGFPPAVPEPQSASSKEEIMGHANIPVPGRKVRNKNILSHSILLHAQARPLPAPLATRW